MANGCFDLKLVIFSSKYLAAKLMLDSVVVRRRASVCSWSSTMYSVVDVLAAACLAVQSGSWLVLWNGVDEDDDADDRNKNDRFSDALVADVDSLME